MRKLLATLALMLTGGVASADYYVYQARAAFAFARARRVVVVAPAPVPTVTYSAPVYVTSPVTYTAPPVYSQPVYSQPVYRPAPRFFNRAPATICVPGFG